MVLVVFRPLLPRFHLSLEAVQERVDQHDQELQVLEHIGLLAELLVDLLVHMLHQRVHVVGRPKEHMGDDHQQGGTKRAATKMPAPERQHPLAEGHRSVSGGGGGD